MRPLIRPALFLAARLGLFLSVATWGVAQWWHIVCLASGCFFSIASDGYVLAYSTGLQGIWDISWARSDNVMAPHDSPTHFLPAMFHALSRSTDGVAIRHSVVVTVFALLWVALIWSDRKRPKTPEQHP